MTIKETTLLNGRVKLSQPDSGLRASMDTVLLSAAVKAEDNDHILDMGCGTGGAGLCVLRRYEGRHIYLNGIDVQDDLISLATQNGSDNGFGDRCTFMTGNIADKSRYAEYTFDHILTNPPYYEEGKRQSSPDKSREIAFAHTDIKTWIDRAHYWLKHNGSLSIIHRADMLDKILLAAGARFGGIEIWPVHSKADKPAIRVIVKLLKNRRSPLVLHPAVILFDTDGQESGMSKRILRDGEGLI